MGMAPVSVSMIWEFLQSAGHGGPGFSRGKPGGSPRLPSGAAAQLYRKYSTGKAVESQFPRERQGKDFPNPRQEPDMGAFRLFSGLGKEKKPVWEPLDTLHPVKKMVKLTQVCRGFCKSKSPRVIQQPGMEK